MIDNKVSVRRYLKASFAASGRSECLGLVLVVAPPSEIGQGRGVEDAALLSGTLGPYVGLIRAVPPGCEDGGVSLPDGVRVVADGLAAHHWPGSEPAFRTELAAPAPDSWDHGQHRRDRLAQRSDVGRRANSEIAWYFGVEPRSTPTVIVLDPSTRRGTVISLPRTTSVRAFCARMVDELGGWPLRRLALVESLVEALLDHARLERADARVLVDQLADPDEEPDRVDDHQRAVLCARRFDALADAGLLPATSAAPAGNRNGNGNGRDERRRIDLFRAELDRADRAVTTADAAVRAAMGEIGAARRSQVRAPDTFVGWRFEQVHPATTLHRLVGAALGRSARTSESPSRTS